MNPGSVGNIARIPELNRRIAFTFALLTVYRIGCAIPTPGVNVSAIKAFFAQQSGALGLINLFSGGALEQFSIFALGIMPYISASIILQLLTVVIPHLAELKKEGEEGRRVITRYTRYGTVILAVIQGSLISGALEAGAFGDAVVNPGWGFRVMTVITLTAGTAFIMWLGEQITERGIGNGISLIIFAGIVTAIPSALSQTAQLVQTGQMVPIMVLVIGVLMLGVVFGIVYMEKAQRRIPIQHARRVVGRRQTSGGMSYFPLRLNSSGVIPPIFASSLLFLPSQIEQYADSPVIQNFVQDYLDPAGFGFNLVYIALIVFFAYFYTGVMINPDDVADNIKKSGGYIPGIRPGARTANYIERVLNRITLIGAIYLAAVCVLPVLLTANLAVPFFFGGTALLIIVSVAMDTMSQVEAHLVARNYESFIQGTRVRGRRV